MRRLRSLSRLAGAHGFRLRGHDPHPHQAGRAVIFSLAERHGSADEAIVAADKVVAIVPEGSKGCIIRTVGEPLFVAATAAEAAAALGFELRDLRSAALSPSASQMPTLLSRLRSRSSPRG